MRKRTKHSVTIMGTTFETNDNDLIITPWDSIHRGQWSYATLWDAYNKPSDYKVDIWDDWCTWFRENFDYNDAEWWVSSKNCNFFSISGKVRTSDGAMWYLHITYAHNYATRIVDPQ